MRPTLSRRGFLALSLAGATGVAGCGDRLPGTGRQTMDGDRLERMARQDLPSIPETFPVAIEDSFVAEQTDAARAMLDDVPAPLDEEQIPNGAIRERLNRLHDRASERLQEVADAQTPYERLQHTDDARADAREVRAVWRAIDDGLTLETVHEEGNGIGDDIDAFAARWDYVGDDPVRAARVHAEIEGDIVAARNWATFDERYREGEGPFRVGEAASELERARSNLATATYVFERFRASLDAESDLTSRLESARKQLSSRVSERREAFPEVAEDDVSTGLLERDVGETTGVWALAELHREVRFRSGGDPGPEPSLARSILDGTRILTLFRAFESLRERIEGGDDVAVETAEDVVALREAAVAALEAAWEADVAPELVREALWRFSAEYVRPVDRQFENNSRTVPVDDVQRDAARYVVAAETCRALPDVAGEIAAMLRGGS